MDIHIHTYIYKEICFKELVYVIMEAGQSEICRSGQLAGFCQSGAEMLQS